MTDGPVMDPRIARAQAWAAEMRAGFRSIVLGTSSPDGDPEASVSAAVLDPRGAFLVYLSGLAAHTRHLLANPRASVLLAEDDAATSQPLARRRLVWTCTAEVVPREHADYTTGIAALRARCGAAFELVLPLPDFQLLRLVPVHGRLVAGFGETYSVDPTDWTRLTPYRPPRPKA
jgi:putative heme iron utilization protein